MAIEVRQTVKELGAIIAEADPTYLEDKRRVLEYEMSNGRKFFGDYQRRGPYDPIQNVEDGLQDTETDYTSRTVSGA